MKKLTHSERPASSLLEEATHLLKSAPARLYLGLYSGTLPFVLGFLYFWTDMSKGAQAGKSAAAAAFTMALLFVWMKTWQAFFSSRLREHLLGKEPERWPLKRWIRTGLFQAAWQPTGFLVLPLAALILLPYGWAYAFYRNLLIFGTGAETDSRNIVRTSWRQAALHPLQNNALFLILGLFGLVVFINSMNAIILLPSLLKTLLGIESVFTRAGFSIFNTTLLAVGWGASYLVMEPLVNATYTIRCFYGESVATGEDLKSELDSYKTSSVNGRAIKAVLVVLLIGATLITAPLSYAEKPTMPNNATVDAGIKGAARVTPREIDEAAANVLQKRKYQWRMPQVEEPEVETREPGLLGTFLTAIRDTYVKWIRSVKNAIDRLLDWLADLFPKNKIPMNPPSLDLGISPGFLVLILILAIGGIGGLVTYRIIRQNRNIEPETGSSSTGSIPDIEDEETLADELHSNEWLRLASELMNKGEERLALRALYLACLSRLADIDLISIAAYKSNKDYLRELVSRAHALPGLLETFTENVRTFERVWYGKHAASREMLRAFNLNNKRMFAIAEPQTS